MTRLPEVVPGHSRSFPKVIPEVVPGHSHPFRGGGNGNDPGERRGGYSRNEIRERPHAAKLVAAAGEQQVKGGLTAADPQVVNVRGGSGDPERGSYVTPEWLARRLPRFDLDPFSNPRSHIVADRACMLERGDDGFGDGRVGSFMLNHKRPGGGTFYASENTRVWLQPPYEKGFVARAFQHYAHTRWVALLRFDPRPPWFDMVYDAAELVAIIRSDPDGKPFNFDAPPEIRRIGRSGKQLKQAGNSFPHAIYARHAEDVPDAVLEHCCAFTKEPTT